MSHETKPTAADLRGCAADRMYPIYPDARRFLLAGADAMDERDRLREKVDELECTLDDEEASGSESVAIINKLRAENAELAKPGRKKGAGK